MMKRSVLGVVVGTLVALGGLPAAAHTRTPWRIHQGLEVNASNPLGLVQFSCTPARNGDVCEYNGASIPPEGDAGWGAPPGGESIHYAIDSRVCQAPVSCYAYGDFTYFDTLINVTSAVSDFRLTFDAVDDGVRLTIFNSQYPNGITVPDGYAYVGVNMSTGNLAAYLKVGETSRVVITQVDDCCSRSRLEGVTVLIDGQPVALACEGNGDCNDGDDCTADICEQGSCSNPLLACSNGRACGGPIMTVASGGAAPMQVCTPRSDGQPSLVANGNLDMTLECGQDTWVDPGAEAWDAACHPLTVHTYNSGHDTAGPGPNTCVEGTYSVQYIAWDAAGRTVSAIRSVRVDDTTPPTFTLRGATDMTLQCGHGYVEPGWDAWDACYGNITPEVKVYGYPNGWVEGTYTVTYTLTDSGGNSAPTLTRTVHVVDCPW